MKLVTTMVSLAYSAAVYADRFGINETDGGGEFVIPLVSYVLAALAGGFKAFEGIMNNKTNDFWWGAALWAFGGLVAGFPLSLFLN